MPKQNGGGWEMGRRIENTIPMGY
jgi:hypothetical protein